MALPARVVYSSLFFALTMALLAVSKPSALFASDGSVRPFGFAKEGEAEAEADDEAQGTVFPLGVVVVVAAVLSMYMFSMIDLIYA
jgi:hypothetical protein